MRRTYNVSRVRFSLTSLLYSDFICTQVVCPTPTLSLYYVAMDYCSDSRRVAQYYFHYLLSFQSENILSIQCSPVVRHYTQPLIVRLPAHNKKLIPSVLSHYNIAMDVNIEGRRGLRVFSPPRVNSSPPEYVLLNFS